MAQSNPGNFDQEYGVYAGSGHIYPTGAAIYSDCHAPHSLSVSAPQESNAPTYSNDNRDPPGYYGHAQQYSQNEYPIEKMQSSASYDPYNNNSGPPIQSQPINPSSQPASTASLKSGSHLPQPPNHDAPLSPSQSFGSGLGNRTEDFSQPGKFGVVDIDTVYRAVPSNGMFFGPYLRYGNLDLNTGTWYGSVMIVIGSKVAPYFQIHPTNDIGQIRAIEARQIYQFENFRFFRYNIALKQLPGNTGQFWTYAITHQGNTLTYKFIVAGMQETEWKFMAFSCADFSLSVKEGERAELGGIGYLWEDVITKHHQIGGLHAMLGGGDQIYADRMWKEISSLQDWLATKGKINRKNYEWTPRLEHDINLAYFFYYTNHFDRVGIRDCLSQIPNVFQIDDHDIFDGYGSYPEYMQESQVFKNIGRVAFHFYLLFQHQTTDEFLRISPDPFDLFTVTGNGWHFLKYMGPTCVVLGPDTRAERHQRSIIGEITHRELFHRLELLPPSVRHIVLMLAVPIVYPRLTAVEHILNGVKHTKRAINGAWNVIGKATSKVASVIGADKHTKTGFDSVKKAFGKSGVMGTLVSGFGEIDLLDDLADHWTHAHHETERTFFVRNLQRIARENRVRVTFVSGDVHCCGMGRFFNPSDPDNYQLMYQVITSAISNVPPPGAVIRLLHNRDKLYLPEIGSKEEKTDTREEMIEFFERDVDGEKLDLRKLLPRRNYAIAALEPDGTMAWDLYVQKGGRYGVSEHTQKYGPLIVPPIAQPGSEPNVEGYGVPDGSGYDEQYRRQQMMMAPGGVYGPGGLAEGMNYMNLKP
ncbi:hypothetical protein V1508DRAFT_438992 [Lipomyces doorenjongii]|uniref:uncharacterized protein n=1 Tax=Lipomyces doorenjongii TaxID=383834 RepID=UPI0034CD80E0